MGEGIQVVLNRKYSPAYKDFLLYPTFGFSRQKNLELYFQPQYHELVKKSVVTKKKTKTEIQYYAHVEDVIEINRANFEKLRNISPHYIWSPNHVFNYFLKDERCENAYIWILRIYRLENPEIIDNIRGAITYANLPAEIDITNLTPVLNQQEFNSKVKKLRSDIESLLSETDLEKLEDKLQEKDELIELLKNKLESKEEQIRLLENKIGPSSLEIIISKLTDLQGLAPVEFEWFVTKAFEEIGFDAKWNGESKDGKPVQIAPSGRPDIEIKAPLAGDPYFIVLEVTKMDEERYQVTEIHGAVDHSHVYPGLPFKTCYRLVIAPRFRRGAIEACENLDPKYSVMLLTNEDFLEILRFHSEVGGITQEEFKNLFEDQKSRGEIQRKNIERWETTVREQRKRLSLALDVYDILYSEKGFMWPRDIWRELKKQRSRQSLTLETQTDVLDILKILDMIGAVIVKPSPDDDPDKCNYKAGLTPEGFRLRIRKLAETIKLLGNNKPTRKDKISLWFNE